MKVFSRVLSFFVGIGLLGGIAYLVVTGDSFKISSIQVKDISVIQNATLFSAISPGVEALAKMAEGKKIWSIPIGKLQDKILEDTRVQSVQISRSLSGKLVVGISPHIPQALLLKSKGRVFPVANDGTVLPEVKGLAVFDAPLLRGHSLEVDKLRRERVVSFLSGLKDMEYFNQTAISDVVYDSKNGLEIYMQANNLLVKLGTEDWSEQAVHVNQVMQYLLQEGIKDRVIDARFSKKVVVKLRNES